MSPEIESRILAATARVYAQYGFRGATTRLIASEAGVNEVTLFRIFGSKARLLQAMLVSQVSTAAVPFLAASAGAPQEELTRWCRDLLGYLRGHAHIIRKTIGEAAERPDAACAACEGPNSSAASLLLYVEQLREEGLADAEADVDTAVSMLMSALFGDALYRDIMADSFPQPVDAAAAKYVQTFLRAVGVQGQPGKAKGVRKRREKMA